MITSPSPVLLQAAGTMAVLDIAGPGLPRLLHWGPDVGPLDPDGLNALVAAVAAAPVGLDEPLRLTLLPAQSDGWLGRPGLSGHRDGGWPHLRLALTEPVTISSSGPGGRVIALAADAQAGIATRSELILEPQGVLRVRHSVTNTGPGTYTVDRVEALVPVPGHAREVLDFTGRWAHERSPQRSAFLHGSHVRESRRGRTGHDATGLLIVGADGFGFRHGEVWGVHIGWSGDHVHVAERHLEGVAVLGGGELLGPGEVRLAPGDSYTTPWAYFSCSDAGLDGLSGKLHSFLRARAAHPSSPRPVVLNTWEAVYFDHDLDRLTRLADVAAQVGVERFVLDDGWFLGRRDDTAGLGDWYVDPEVWPDGLRPLVAHVRSRGMQFGLWFEPEMVNPSSRLAAEHPDWILAHPDRWPMLARKQLVLDVAHPDAFAYLLQRLDSLVSEYDIDYIKWDHNRDLLEAVHSGGAGVHAQTEAVYRLLAEVRARHPQLEIESCSSGGARIDYGILDHTDRVWTSDTNDAFERQSIQRWTGLLLPPELMGSHVGPPTAHTTGRAAGLPFRMATAMFGHAGIEWDLTTCDDGELAELTGWIALHKRLRPLLHAGDVVHADHPDPAALLHGVVAADRGHGVYAYAQLAASSDSVGAPVRLPGLDPRASYALRVLPELLPGELRRDISHQPPWLRAATFIAPGAVLATVGLQAPLLRPGTALALELERVQE